MKMKKISLALLPFITVLVMGCGSDGDDDATTSVTEVDEADDTIGTSDTDGENGNLAIFTVQLTNLTFGQPLSPAAIILHESGFNTFIDGESASLGLEQLAEAGDPAELIFEALAAVEYLGSVTIEAATPPKSVSDISTLSIPLLDVEDLRISFTTMLVDTNDAFTALNAANISNMTVGQSMTFTTPTWDAGTEANTETANTMPGPAASAAGGGGENAGFDAARDDLFDLVHFHTGVVTNANASDGGKEGLNTSVLTEADRWDNPTAQLIVTRTK